MSSLLNSEDAESDFAETEFETDFNQTRNGVIRKSESICILVVFQQQMHALTNLYVVGR